MRGPGEVMRPPCETGALVEAACTGGSDAADGLIRAVWPRAYRIALSVLRDTSLAEDAAQESCAALFRSVRKLRSPSAFNVWFYRIVVRESLALQKRACTQAAPLEPFTDVDIESALVRIDVGAALAALPSSQRIAIALHYFAEMNSREIGEVLDIPSSSVRFHIMLGKRALQKLLKEAQTGAA